MWWQQVLLRGFVSGAVAGLLTHWLSNRGALQEVRQWQAAVREMVLVREAALALCLKEGTLSSSGLLMAKLGSAHFTMCTGCAANRRGWSAGRQTATAIAAAPPHTSLCYQARLAIPS